MQSKPFSFALNLTKGSARLQTFVPPCNLRILAKPPSKPTVGQLPNPCTLPPSSLSSRGQAIILAKAWPTADRRDHYS